MSAPQVHRRTAAHVADSVFAPSSASPSPPSCVAQRPKPTAEEIAAQRKAKAVSGSSSPSLLSFLQPLLRSPPLCVLLLFTHLRLQDAKAGRSSSSPPPCCAQWPGTRRSRFPCSRSSPIVVQLARRPAVRARRVRETRRLPQPRKMAAERRSRPLHPSPQRLPPPLSLRRTRRLAYLARPSPRASLPPPRLPSPPPSPPRPPSLPPLLPPLRLARTPLVPAWPTTTPRRSASTTRSR